MNFKERKAIREAQNQDDTISAKLYNSIIGMTLLLGFVINAIVVVLLLPCIADISDTTFIVGLSVFVLIGGIMVYLTKNPVLGVIGYILVSIGVGIFFAFLISCDIVSVLLAIILTGIITVVMLALAVLKPSIFSSTRFLIPICLLIAVISAVIATVLGYSGDWFSWIFVVVFSLCIGYNFRKAQQCSKTGDNAINSALDLYFDILLLFISIMKGKYKSKDD